MYYFKHPDTGAVYAYESIELQEMYFPILLLMTRQEAIDHLSSQPTEPWHLELLIAGILNP